MSYEDNIPVFEDIDWHEITRKSLILLAAIVLVAILLSIHWGI